MSQVIEWELLRAAQAGDDLAYEDLQARLEPDLRRFVRRMIQHSETEDDILQDVFIAFYQNLTRIDPVETLRPYLFRIARNRCYDDLRRIERRRDALSIDDEPVEARIAFTEAYQPPRPDDTVHWLLLHMEVREAIDRLPEAQRQALLLFSEEQMSYAEIAQVTDVSVGTIKSRLFHAKRNLRGLLRPQTLAQLETEFSASERAAPETEEMHT